MSRKTYSAFKIRIVAKRSLLLQFWRKKLLSDLTYLNKLTKSLLKQKQNNFHCQGKIVSYLDPGSIVNQRSLLRFWQKNIVDLFVFYFIFEATIEENLNLLIDLLLF